MQNNKSIRHFQWISGIVALFFIFMLMSLSDVLRLNPSLAGVSRSELGKTAREASVSVTTRVAIPAEDYNNEDKVDFSDEGVGATLTGAESSFVLQEETYYIVSLEAFRQMGGKLDTDKFGAPKVTELEGSEYLTGKLVAEQNLWRGLNNWSRFVLTLAPFMMPCLVIAACAFITALILSLNHTAAASGVNTMSYVTSRISVREIWSFISNNIIIVLILLFALVVSCLKPTFTSEESIRNLLSNTSIRFIIALGVSGCLITKGTDLSAGRIAGFAACISAILLQRGDYGSKFYPNMGEMPIIVVLLIVLAICAILGILNGVVIAVLKVPPFIATLGMQQLVYGVCLVYTGASPIGGLRKDYTSLATGYIGNRMISYVLIIAVGIGIFMWFLYNKTRHGKFMYAIGGNEVAAEVSGINTVKTKILIYMLAAILYGVMGFLSTSKAGGASVNTAMSYELEAIAGCTIGGVSVNGGVGRISGILVGVLVFEVLKIALQFLGVESSYTYIVQGLVIIVAIALDIRKYYGKK